MMYISFQKLHSTRMCQRSDMCMIFTNNLNAAERVMKIQLILNICAAYSNYYMSEI